MIILLLLLDQDDSIDQHRLRGTDTLDVDRSERCLSSCTEREMTYG